MNQRDLQFVEKIMEEIRGLRNSATLVFNTTFTQIGKTNLLLLKGLLDIEQLTGYFIVLDRPHQYMSYLLHMHKVSQENLWFIDSVTHQSGVKMELSDRVEFLEGPFHVENLFKTFEMINDGKGKGFVSMDRVDFLLVDNIATMLNYNNIEQIEEFVISLKAYIEKYPHMMGGVTIDKESHPELSEILLEHYDYMIDLEDLKKDVEK